MSTRHPLEVRAGPPRPYQNPIMAKKRNPDTFGRIEIKLDQLARRAGLVTRGGKPNRAAIQRRTGINDETLFYLLRHPDLVDRIHFRTLAKICNAFGVGVADVLVYTPHMGGETPLSDLYKTETGG